jgi:hypothetical protein
MTRPQTGPQNGRNPFTETLRAAMLRRNPQHRLSL